VRLPRVNATIERRLLVNYRVEPDIVAPMLPEPFRAQLVGDFAVAGICMIRLGSLRPTGLPGWVGLRSENAAHRIAVEWDSADGVRTGVYIPRRDTDALANAMLGGRVYPGEHHRARFCVTETPDGVSVAYSSLDGSTSVSASVAVSDRLEGSRLFPDLDAASRFFQEGSVGFSATRDGCRLDGLQLETTAWSIEAAVVESASSSFFDDVLAFPAGSATLDSALVMRNVPVSWKALPPLSSRTRA
jgi:hypothetical protein